MAEKPAPAGHGIDAVESYLAGVESPQRETLERVRVTIRSLLPYAREELKYGMPAFTLDGKGVASYAAFKQHCSYFPMSGVVIEQAGDALDGYETSRGGIRFPVDGPLPIDLIRRLVKLRMAEISTVENGRRREYFPDGRLKATGQMKDGLQHGKWQWFRQDGTLMRTGQFSKGEKVGTWTTSDRDDVDPTT